MTNGDWCLCFFSFPVGFVFFFSSCLFALCLWQHFVSNWGMIPLMVCFPFLVLCTWEFGSSCLLSSPPMPSVEILVGCLLLGCTKWCVSMASIKTGLSLSISALLYVLLFWIWSNYSPNSVLRLLFLNYPVFIPGRCYQTLHSLALMSGGSC